MIYGFGSYFNSELAGKYGPDGIYPLAWGSILCFVHNQYTHRNDARFYGDNNQKYVGVLARALVYILGCACAATAFGHSQKANINKGIVIALFTSNVVFTTLQFGIVYGERVSL